MTKKTVLYNEHTKRNARIIDFSGWLLPVMYTSIIEEHNATRNDVTLFDVSHMGEFSIKGPEARQFLKKMIPTRLNKIEPGKSMYSVLCNESGGVIDDIFIYMLSDNEFYLVVNAARITHDLEWLQNHLVNGVEIVDLSEHTAKIDVQGPKARMLLKDIFNEEISQLKRFHFQDHTFQSNLIRISYSGYTGESGFEIYIPDDCACELWNTLLECGKQYNIQPAGLGARDTLRVEASYSLYGHELSETINPVQAGLKWLVSSEENYIGKSSLLNEIENGPAKTIIPFTVEGRGIPREGYPIYFENEQIGYVTSGIFSPTLKKSIGYALVKNGLLQDDDTFFIKIRNNLIPAHLSKRPFYSYKG